jgi:hypothetical protein
MKIAHIFSHKNGEDILQSPRFSKAYEEFLSVLPGLPPYRATKPKKKPQHIVNPEAMNRWLTKELSIDRDWDWHPLIIHDPDNPHPRSQVRSDFRKDKIEVEVQFGNVARYTYDVYKMAIALARGVSNVGLMVVATRQFAQIIGSNVAYYERAVRELVESRLTLMVPLAVLGIEPEEWDPNHYPLDTEAPKATAALVNAARAARGAPPVPEDIEQIEEEEEQSSLSLEHLKRIVARLAS